MPKPDKIADAAAAPVPEPVVAPSTPPSVRSTTELCRDVERTLEREPADRVKCTHLFGDYYRCNWWSRVGAAKAVGGYDWAALLTDHIRKSRFLKVTQAGGALSVEEIGVTAAVDAVEE